MELPNKPKMTWENIKRMEDMSHFESALIFDDFLIVSQMETCCFVWKTECGLVVFDGIWPDQAVYDAIILAITKVGWKPDEIKKFVITHGHVDHAGCGKWLVKNHNVTTYLSKTDTDFWEEHPTKPDRKETWKDFDIDIFVGEGDVIQCGVKEIKVLSTPGHTPGCLSYIFPVKENGEVHMAGLFGGATPPWNNEKGTKQFLESVEHFAQVCKDMDVDVILSNHTVFDNGMERICYSQKRRSYLPNIYILGKEGALKFLNVYEQLAKQ